MRSAIVSSSDLQTQGRWDASFWVTLSDIHKEAQKVEADGQTVRARLQSSFTPEQALQALQSLPRSPVANLLRDLAKPGEQALSHDALIRAVGQRLPYESLLLILQRGALETWVADAQAARDRAEDQLKSTQTTADALQGKRPRLR